MAYFDWEELQRRLDYLKNLIQDHRVIPDEGYGLHYMIEETEGVLNQEKKDIREADLINETIKSVKGIQSLWALTESQKILDSKGIEYHSQLMNCREGKIDFGEKEENRKDIYYKDFELEIFIAAMIAANTNLKVELPQDQGPFDVIIESDIAIQIKHPTNINNAFNQLGKFGKNLDRLHCKGIFAVGHEDAFSYGDRIQFPNEAEFNKYFHTIAGDIENFGKRVLPKFKKFENIVGFIGTTTLYVLIGTDLSARMNLRRHSNSFLVENRVSGEKYSQIIKVLNVFNPDTRKIIFDNNNIISTP
jgi:hypothetical protein